MAGRAIWLCMLISCALCDKEYEAHGSNYSDDADSDMAKILGSDGEVDRLAKLDPKTAKQELADIFEMMDADHNGGVDSEELISWIRNSMVKRNLLETLKKMKNDDKSNDSLLSWSEYTISVYGDSADDLESVAKEKFEDPEVKEKFEKHVHYDKNKFKAADENGDGLLTLDEYSAFLHPYDYPRMSEVESNRVLADYDTDDDGTISLEEYLYNPIFKELTEEEMLGEEENFKYFDKDSDGKLSRKEILKWVAPDIQTIASEQADHLFAVTDADKDGTLSKDEIVAEYEIWSRSDVAGYKDQNLSKDEL